MTATLLVLWLGIAGDAAGAESQVPDAKAEDATQAVIDDVEKQCLERTVYMIGRKKAVRLAELVRRRKPKLVVECGSAIGYSGLWIARELNRYGGKLITIEISPERAKEAQENYRRAGLAGVVTSKVGDARQVVHQIEGPVGFVFLDCGYANYLPCLQGLQDKLSEKAVVVADNVGMGAGGMSDYLEHVRNNYQSRTEWFDIDLPWGKRDAMEISVKK